jgi:CrcB protein
LPDLFFASLYSFNSVLDGMWIFVTVGGATGALARYWLSGWVNAAIAGFFPIGTLVVNVVGSLLLGFGMQAMEAVPVSAEVRTMLTIGFLGAFTTFSTFSYETVTLLRDGDWTRATLYTGLSLVLGLTAVLIGIGVASVLLKVRG